MRRQGKRVPFNLFDRVCVKANCGVSSGQCGYIYAIDNSNSNNPVYFVYFDGGGNNAYRESEKCLALETTTIPTAVSMSSDKQIYAPNETVVLSIFLYRTDTSQSLPNFSIQIYLNGVLQKIVTTGTGGYVTTTIKAPLGSGQHSIRAFFGGFTLAIIREPLGRFSKPLIDPLSIA